MLQQPSFSVHHHHITTPTVANADINFSPNALDNDIKNTNSVNTYHDTANNFTFTLTRKNGTAYISPVQTEGLTELKIGVLLPFHQQDNNWTKTITLSGASAVRMAIAEINTKQIIPGAYITLIEQDSFPKDIEGQAAISQAVYSAISLIHEGVVAIIGDISSSWTTLSALMSTTLQIPQCSFSAVATSLSDKSQYGYFFRTIPTDLIYADAALSFIVSQGWPTIGVLYSGDDFGKQLSTDVIMKARAHNIIIKGYQSFYDHGPTSDIQSSIDTLMATGARVIFVAAADDAPMAALIVAAHSGYINNDNVWLTIGIQSDSLQQNVINFNNIISTRADSAEWSHMNDNNTGIISTSSNISVPQSSASQSSASQSSASQSSASQSSASQSSASQSSASSSVLPNIDPVLYAANTTRKLTHIEYNSTFSGGVFSFESIMSLPGYPPFDQFLQRWSSLDPAMYPYGGQGNISGNEGFAYSCMMNLAQGFNSIIRNSSNATTTLHQLAYRQLGDELSPLAFNTSYVGPEGPIILDQNGDMIHGNYRINNIQNGTNINIGNIIAGELGLTSLPIYHDGTTNVPTGVPPKVYLNPGYSTPLSITLVTVSAVGTFTALVTICLVLLYRKREVFRESSPLFCVLQLIGFILCYIAAFFFAGDRSKLTCVVVPVAFNLGYSLVLGNLIAKNYRIYRVFNNIFITRTLVRNSDLLKVSGSILLLETIIIVLWFCLCIPQTRSNPVSQNAYYLGCYYNGPSHPLFVTLLTLIASCELAFATFLAFKTRAIGRNYSKYSEYKQIGLSIYNIFFCALIGTIVFFLPTADYYTQHYLTATMIVWATTFCLFILFLPKFVQFRRKSSSHRSSQGVNKISDLPERQQRSYRQRSILSINNNDSNNNSGCSSNSSSSNAFHSTSAAQLDYRSSRYDEQQQSFGELLSMNGVLNGDQTNQNSYQQNCYPRHRQQHQKYQQTQEYHIQHRQLYHRTHIVPTTFSKSQQKKQRQQQQQQEKGTVLDAYEARMPVQRIMKYIPWLSRWDMQQIVLLPQVSYFSYYSERARKGSVFDYSHASIVSSTKEAYVLKVHGRRFHDVLIQVANQDDLLQWCAWFNSNPSGSPSASMRQQQEKHSATFSFLARSKSPNLSCMTTNNGTKSKSSSTAVATLQPSKLNPDSGLTIQHLLAEDDDDEDERHESSMTLTTLDSCYHGQDAMATTDDTMMARMTTIILDNDNPNHTTTFRPSYFTTANQLGASSSNLHTPDSEERTMIGTPSHMDDEIIMMHDLK